MRVKNTWVKLLVGLQLLYPLRPRRRRAASTLFLPIRCTASESRTRRGRCRCVRWEARVWPCARRVWSICLIPPPTAPSRRRPSCSTSGWRARTTTIAAGIRRVEKHGLQYVQLPRYRLPDARGQETGTGLQPDALQLGGLPYEILPRVRSLGSRLGQCRPRAV